MSDTKQIAHHFFQYPFPENQSDFSHNSVIHLPYNGHATMKGIICLYGRNISNVTIQRLYKRYCNAVHHASL